MSATNVFYLSYVCSRHYGSVLRLSIRLFFSCLFAEIISRLRVPSHICVHVRISSASNWYIYTDRKFDVALIRDLKHRCIKLTVISDIELITVMSFGCDRVMLHINFIEEVDRYIDRPEKSI